VRARDRDGVEIQAELSIPGAGVDLELTPPKATTKRSR
jgi:hypothetical protein